jgi:hypothetical protein
VEFFEEVRDHLSPDGVLVLNAGHPKGEDAFEKVLSATIGEAFPYVMRDPVKPTNTLIVASRAPLSAAGLRGVPPQLRVVASEQTLEPPLRGGDVYTDDKAPVEWLIDKSIVDYAAGE